MFVLLYLAYFTWHNIFRVMLQHVSEFPSVLRLNKIPLYVCTMCCLSIDWHLGYFYLLTVANNVAVKVSIQISVQVPAFNSLGYMFRSGYSESYDNSMVIFWRSCFPQQLQHFIFPPAVHRGSSVFTSSPMLAIFWIFFVNLDILIVWISI